MSSADVPADRPLGGAARAVAKVRPVLRAAEVKPRCALELEARPTAHAQHAADQPVTVRPVAELADLHEILNLPDPAVGQEARDQHVRVRQVQLLGLPPTVRRPEHEPPAPLRVEQRREHARRVKTRRAIPVDRPVGRDQRDRVEIADHPVLGDRRIGPRAHNSRNATRRRDAEALDHVVSDAQRVGEGGQGSVDGA
jgi:hypothetical protein